MARPATQRTCGANAGGEVGSSVLYTAQRRKRERERERAVRARRRAFARSAVVLTTSKNIESKQKNSQTKNRECSAGGLDARDQRRRVKRVDAGIDRRSADVEVDRRAAAKLKQDVQKRERVFPAGETYEDAVAVLHHTPLGDRAARHEHKMLRYAEPFRARARARIGARA